MALQSLVPHPSGQVDLNGNIVSGKNLTGGYTSFQLWPNGQIIKPATDSTEKLTLANVDSLFCYKESGKFDLFLAKFPVDFRSGELVELSGPIRDPQNPQVQFVQMKGTTSSLMAQFSLVSSTADPPKGISVGPISQNSSVTLRVEQSGKIVFDTTIKL